jgi:hypothetical protein
MSLPEAVTGRSEMKTEELPPHLDEFEQGCWEWACEENDTGNANLDEAIESIGNDFRRLLMTISKLKGALHVFATAYGPVIIPPPSKEEVLAVNLTPAFEIGRNAMCAHIAELATDALKGAN